MTERAAASVLIADDSIVVRALMRRQLEDHGFRVVEAEDGATALSLCLSERPDVALLDIEMPTMNGHEVLAALQADAELAQIPVVFVTGRTATDDVTTGLRLGAHDYLRKPFDPAELIARVSAAARVKFLQDELRARNVELDLVSRTDPLTGLANRRHAMEELPRHASAARRSGLSLSVVMFDVDHFKSINDEFGHAGGDAVLQELSARVRPILRPEDVASRWGGDEFLFVLPATDRAGASAFGERLRDAVTTTAFRLGGDRVSVVTISGGIATGDGDDPDELVRTADGALYTAKERGRNRIVAAD